MDANRSISLMNGISSTESPSVLSCILCMECIGDWNALQRHLVKNHEVKTEALHAFMSLVDFNEKDAFHSVEKQIQDGGHPNVSDSTAEFKRRPRRIASSSSPSSSPSVDRVSNNSVNHLGCKNDEPKRVESTKTDSFGESERLVKRRSEVICNICLVAFADCELLSKHQDATGHHHTEWPPSSAGQSRVQRKRSECDKTSPGTAPLRSNNIPVPGSTGEGQFLCPQCNQVFEKREKLRMHCYCHKMEKATECRSCEVRFNSILEFRRHQQDVHDEELTSEQQERYEASIAAASSLALLGASGLEHASSRPVSSSANSTAAARGVVREKETQRSERNGPGCRQFDREVSTAGHLVNSRLDENSNSCVQIKFVGVKGSEAALDEKLLRKQQQQQQQQQQRQQQQQQQEQNGGDRIACRHDNHLHNKCIDCRVDLGKTVGPPQSEPTEKRRRKISRPTKVTSDLTQQSSKQINDVFTSDEKIESGSTDTFILNLAAGTGSNRSPLTSSVASGNSHLPPHPHPPSTSSVLTGSGSSLFSRSSQGINRPFKCPLCKVSYAQKSQLDDHFATQQHLSRSSRISSDGGSVCQNVSTINLQAPSTSQFTGNLTDQTGIGPFAAVSFPSFVPFGVPLINTLMTPLLTNCFIPSVASAGHDSETDLLSPSPTTKRFSGAGNESGYRKVDLKSEPDLNFDLGSRRVSCDEATERSRTELSFSGLRQTFSSVEHLDRHIERVECVETASDILAPDLRDSDFTGTMMESILQRIGYDCVKLFNEQRRKPKHHHKRNGSNVESSREKNHGSKYATTTTAAAAAKELATRNTEDIENKQAGNSDCRKASRDSVDTYHCWTCLRPFLSISALKSHREQVHRQIIPIEVIEKLHNELKSNHEETHRDKECDRTADRSGEKRRHDATKSPAAAAVAARQSRIEEDVQLKQQQQQLQLAAAVQNMQMSMMLSMGILPQVFPRLPGPNRVPPELFSIVDPVLMMQLQQCTPTAGVSMAPHTAGPSAAAQASTASQKSSRTRISEQQLRVLRANFDINNSPTEDQIRTMSEKTALAMKVIKHWFRNTLFKERQRNKDSPYNFNVPPATSLSLEDYVTTITSAPKADVTKDTSSSSDENASNANFDLRSEPKKNDPLCTGPAEKSETSDSVTITKKTSASEHREDRITTSSLSISPTPNEFKLKDSEHGIGSDAGMTNSLYGLSPGTDGVTQDRRAGRTRFSNQQNQVLQEVFDRNPYPKDEDLEALALALDLRVRVIVVWFQNARQRVRKTDGQSLPTDGPAKPALPFQSLGRQQQQIDLSLQRTDEHGLNGDSIGADGDDDDEEEEEEEELGSRSSPGNEANHVVERSSIATKLECDKTHSQDPHRLLNSTGQQTFCGQKSSSSSSSSELSRNTSEAFPQHQSSDDDEHRGSDRRMRTTLAQDQLDHLYENFAVDSNPSRSALEAIAARLNLKPRVVQVWFQNTRARERRGAGHRRTLVGSAAAAQRSLVRCPFCLSMFRGKVALDAHVADQHPNAAAGAVGDAVVRNAQPPSMHPGPGAESAIAAPFLAPGPVMLNAAGIPSPLQTNMNYLYEKSFQQYILQLTNLQLQQATAQQQQSSSSPLSSNESIQSSSSSSSSTTKPPRSSATKPDEGPLDLTVLGSCSASRSDHAKPESVDNSYSTPLFSQNLEDSFSENDDNGLGVGGAGGVLGADGLSLGTSSLSRHGASPFGAGKRYRTQMSGVQVRVMRSIFASYKTPSLVECEVLGQQIGLGKRVVQVWFQNSRAKEKKTSFFPGQEKSEVVANGSGGLSPPQSGGGSSSSSGGGGGGGGLSSECLLCCVTYGVGGSSLQDHLFTKAHIDRVKATVVTSSNGSSEFFGKSSFAESDFFSRCRTTTPSAGFLPLIKSASNSSAMISSKASESAVNVHNNAKNVPSERDNKRLRETRDPPTDLVKNSRNNTQMLSTTMPFVNPLDSSLRQFLGIPSTPADLIGAMMPYLYPGGAIAPVVPGFNPVQFLSQVPNILPDMTTALFNSAAMYGIPLAQLQIPKRAIEQIQDQLRDKASCLTARYTDDCLTSADARAHLASSEELTCLVEKTIHVGYICKKCHVVFPQVNACSAHQAALCYKDTAAERTCDTVLKLEQQLYHCSPCKVNCSTVKEFRAHCAQERHRKAAAAARLGTSQQRVENIFKDGHSLSANHTELKLEDV